MTSKIQKFDYVVLGTGIYGLYAATLLLQKGYKVALVERDKTAFGRASYVNQARVHYGYHYPRSISTAKYAIKYFKRFKKDFNFAINDKFKKIYALSSGMSYTSAKQYAKFCKYLGIPSFETDPSEYFNEGTIESAFETEEYSFDAMMIKNHFMEKIKSYKNVEIFFNKNLENAEKKKNSYILQFGDGSIFETSAVLNATYASVNQIIDKFNHEKFKLKYEISEIILCKVSNKLKGAGITIMDGPFLSIMPFGLSEYYSLSAVQYTPHRTSFNDLPTFDCQAKNENCSPTNLDNCNSCAAKPETSWKYMLQLSKKYLNPEISISYESSLFAIKPILVESEIDDSRPTIIKTFSENPTFISVLSGKINGIYELERLLT